MERIYSRVISQEPEAKLEQLHEFTQSLKGLPVAEQERRSSEKQFREPIMFGGWVVRPFWRDWRKAPSVSGKTIKGEKAEQYMVRGH